MDVCELLPRHARLADKFTLIRSVSHNFSAHAGGVQQVLTGRAPREREKEEPDYPDVGSIFKKVRSHERAELPQYATMPFRFESGGPAYLGKGYEPFVLPGSPNAPRYEVPNVTISTATASRLGDRLELLSRFDTMCRELDRSERCLDAHRVSVSGPTADRAANTIQGRCPFSFRAVVSVWGRSSARQMNEIGPTAGDSVGRHADQRTDRLNGDIA